MRSCRWVLFLALILAVANGTLLSGTRAWAGQDRLKPTPCTVAPRVLPEVAGDPAATPMPAAVVGFEADSWVDSPEDLPRGKPASAEVVSEITAAVQEYAGCFNSGEGLLFTAMLSDNAIAHLGSLEDAVAAFNDQAATDPRTIPWVRVGEVRELSDLRVGAVVRLGVLYGDGARGSPQEAFFIFVREGDRWQVDGQITGNVDASYATISPDDGVSSDSDSDDLLAAAPEGFMEVDSAIYAEPTLMSANLMIEAKLMVGFLGEDDRRGVSCQLFVIERGELSATVTAFCQTGEQLAGRSSYLDVEARSRKDGSDGVLYQCKDAALLAPNVAFSCTVELPASTPED